jgi:putative transposase
LPTPNALTLEDLTGIRKRTKVRKAQRNRLAGWSFSQLGQFAAYKACMSGVPILFLPPHYTSQGARNAGLSIRAIGQRKTVSPVKNAGT